jgi:ATP-dependent DNA ligase
LTTPQGGQYWTPIGGRYSAPIDRFSEHFLGQGPKFFKEACSAGLAGIVSKRADAPYRSRRGDDWLKTKCTRRQEFVIGGWRPSAAEGRFLASLLLGYYQGRELSCSMRARSGPEYASGEYRSSKEVLSSPLSELLLFFMLYGPANVQ